MKEFQLGKSSLEKKDFLPVYKVLFVCLVYVHTDTFWSALCCCYPTTTVYSVSDFVVVESKFSGQACICELNCHQVKCSCI